MSKTDIPKKSRNKYGYVKAIDGKNYITTQQMMMTSSNGGGSGGGTIINNQVSVAIGNQIAEKTNSAKEESYTYISSQLSSYVSHNELNSLSYVSLPQLQAMSYITTGTLDTKLADYATTSDLQPTSYVVDTSSATSKTNDDIIVITQQNTVLTLPSSGAHDGQILTIINTSNSNYTLSSTNIVDKEDVSDSRASSSKTVTKTATQYIYYNGSWWEIS